MPRTRGRSALAKILSAGTLAGALLLSACSPQPDQGSQSSVNSSTAQLRLGILGTPPSLDPSSLDEGQSAYIWQSLFDTLLYIDNKGVVQPNAAESWEYSNDGLTLTLKLREGMTFSSGSQVTAAAVKTTLERTVSTPGVNQGKVSAIKSVDAPDDRTVVINLSHQDGSLLPNLAQGPGVIGDPATIKDPSTALRPIGSGPYVLDEEGTTDGATYVLKRREDYWNVGAYPFQKLTVRVIADSTAALNALMAGELDAGTVRADEAPRVEGAGFTLTQIQANTLGSLVIFDRDGELNPALGDVKVRQAINMAIDREGFVAGPLRGRGLATEQIFNPKSGAFDEDLNSRYEFDVEAAKRLLAEAGYGNGFAVVMPSTFLSQPLEPLITAALGKIGISATWEPVPAQEVASSIAGKKYAMAYYARGLGLPPRDVQDYYGQNGLLNPFNPEDPELTALLDHAGAATDQDAQNAAYRKINTYAVENALGAPMVYFGLTWATAPGIKYLGDGSNTTLSVRTFGVTD